MHVTLMCTDRALKIHVFYTWLSENTGLDNVTIIFSTGGRSYLTFLDIWDIFVPSMFTDCCVVIHIMVVMLCHEMLVIFKFSPNFLLQERNNDISWDK